MRREEERDGLINPYSCVGRVEQGCIQQVGGGMGRIGLGKCGGLIH